MDGERLLNDYRGTDLEPHDVLMLLVVLGLVASGAIGLVWLAVWLVLRFVRP
jgi:hypothetical protein